jgi:hypothetical protein
VNGIDYPIKRHRMADWIEKQDSTVFYPQKMHLTGKDKHRVRVKGWKNIFQANGALKLAKVAMPVSDKISQK